MSTLAGVLPETVAAFQQLSNYAASQGIGIGIANYGGLRTLSDTNQILQYRLDDFNAAVNAGQIRPDTTLQRFRPIAPFGSSYHNYGAAFDVSIISRPASMTVEQALAVLGRAASSFGLRWGGTFSNPDTPHFELAIPLADAQRRYQATVGGAGTSVLDNLSFDLSSFLPGLAPASDDDTAAAFDVPATDIDADESGDVAVASGPDQPGNLSAPLLALGFMIAGLVLWAVRRNLR